MVRGQTFLSSFKKILRLLSFHKWKVKVNETDSDYVILVNIQRRIKRCGLDNSHFNFLTYKAEVFYSCHCHLSCDQFLISMVSLCMSIGKKHHAPLKA